MKISEERSGKIISQKQKIRERYKGINAEMLDVIPALPQEDVYNTSKKLRVGVYARVSTDDPRQTSSYELQKNHYEDVVNRHENWILVKIYADEGISGTSLQHRDAFLEMIADCKAGKLDLIITKTVARFARNVIDCIGIARELSAMNPPIGIIFETENIYTLNSNSEMSLSLIATLAQEESHTKSEIMNASIEMRFRRGIFLTPPLLGYDHDEDGNLVINEEEAKTVRLIFFLYLYGYSTQKIADILTELGRRTKLGNTKWSAGTVLNILQNERSCGDVLARKTFTPNYLDHKSKKNRQYRNQYRQKDHHEPIVTRDDFLAVQQMIYNAKYGNKSILPKLHVIDNGVLHGYVIINPRWSGFHAEDYANASVYVPATENSPADASIKIETHSGEFDLRGYEVARGQYFSHTGKATVTFTKHTVKFNTESIKKFPQCSYVEMLVHPGKKIFSIRSTTKENRNSVQWAKLHEDVFLPRTISGKAFLPTLFTLFGWNTAYRYRLTGHLLQNNTESILIYNLCDTEIFISSDNMNEDALPSSTTPFTTGVKKEIVAYPAEWAANFGENYYAQSKASEITEFLGHPNWNILDNGTAVVKEDDLAVTNPTVISDSIKKIMNEMIQEIQNE